MARTFRAWGAAPELGVCGYAGRAQARAAMTCAAAALQAAWLRS